MKETISGVARLPDGPYVFTVVGIPEKVKLDSGHAKRIWTLQHQEAESGETRQRKFHLFPSDYMGIVLALGGVKNGADVEWDDAEVDGKAFSCTLETVKSKDGKYDNYRFKDCAESLPF